MHNRDSILLQSLYEDILLENTGDMKNITVKSDAVERLRKAVSDMLERGAPVERNDYGFNGGDYTTAQMLMGNKDYHIGADEMPVYLIKRILDMLYKYKKTQLGSIYDYDNERSVLEHEIKVATKQQNSKEDHGKIVIDNNDEKYGKVAVTIPEEKLKRGQLNKVVNDYCQQMGMQLAYNQWGKEEFVDKWKVFQKHPVKFSTYYMKPDLARKVAQELFPEIEIKELGGAESSSKEEQVSNNSLKVEIVSKLQTAYGKKLEITLGPAGSPISKNIYFACKNAGLTPKLLSFDMQTKKIFMDDKKESYEILKPFFEQGLDVSDLDRHFENPQEETPTQQTQDGGYPLNVEYVMREGIRIAPDYRSGVPEDAKKVFRECIRYLFPSAKWENYMANLKGDYEQYVKLGKILKDNNFNVDKLREIFNRMKDDGLLKPSRDLKLKKPEQVSEATDKDFPESGFQLFGLQKEGVDFLYKNKYAILGSETGGGKTVQMVYAAELVYKEEKKPILIVTLKRVQSQFVDEIVAVMGEKERKEISINPLTTKKWNVLYYENFSAGKDLESVIKHLSSQEYSVVIFDELHKLKHSTSKRSQNLEQVAQKAKCRWGATATVSANKPMDVKNQLAILGHPMGMLDDGKFKREFAGMVPGGYNGAYVEGDFEDRIRAAEHLNKWMHLTGIYVRHSKEDMRNEKGEKMPDINIDKQTLQSIKDEVKFKREVDAKIKGYKDPNLAISQMLAFRDIIAKQKTDETVKMAMDIVVKNQKIGENNFSASKVLIFTNFIEAGAELLRKTEEALASTNPKWKAYSFLSSTPKKELEMVKKRMEDPNAKILVMSMKMGGTGISFPNTFKTMIVNDYDWTPESVEQSEGRIYRINTNQNVRIIYNINPGGDEKLYANVEMKKQLAKIIQTYRKIYQDEKVSDQDSEALKKIIDAQKKLAQIEEDDLKIIGDAIGNSTMQESFAKYFISKL